MIHTKTGKCFFLIKAWIFASRRMEAMLPWSTSQRYFCNTLAFIDKNGNVARDFNIDPTQPYANSLNQWSDDGKQFWGQLQFDATPKIIYRISISDWSVKKFFVEPLNIGEEFELNANTGQIVYSDYPDFFDTDSRQQFTEAQQKYTYFCMI